MVYFSNVVARGKKKVEKVHSEKEMKRRDEYEKEHVRSSVW